MTTKPIQVKQAELQLFISLEKACVVQAQSAATLNLIPRYIPA